MQGFIQPAFGGTFPLIFGNSPPKNF